MPWSWRLIFCKWNKNIFNQFVFCLLKNFILNFSKCSSTFIWFFVFCGGFVCTIIWIVLDLKMNCTDSLELKRIRMTIESAENAQPSTTIAIFRSFHYFVFFFHLYYFFFGPCCCALRFAFALFMLCMWWLSRALLILFLFALSAHTHTHIDRQPLSRKS